MNIFSALAVFIEWPLLALAPAAAYALGYVRSRRAIVLVASLAWLAYLPYEYAMRLRILCSGECNIRVDLLVLYPLLLLLSTVAGLVIVKSLHRGRHA